MFRGARRIESLAPMGPISLTTQVDASREEVLDFICDLSRRPAWIDHFASDYRLERLDPRGEGAAARFHVGAPGGIKYMETVIAEVERPSRVVEKGHGGHLNRTPVNTVWELTEGPGAVTTVTLTFWTEPGHHFDRVRELGRSRWWRRRWKRALRRLRDAIEAGGEGIEPVRVAGGAHRPTRSPEALAPRPSNRLSPLMSRGRHRAIAAALCVALVGGIAACGEDKGKKDVVEGEPVELGDLKLTVQLTRFLNPNDREDAEYVVGAPELETGTGLPGRLRRARERVRQPVQLPGAEELTVIDTTDQRYRPVRAEHDLLGAAGRVAGGRR